MEVKSLIAIDNIIVYEYLWSMKNRVVDSETTIKTVLPIISYAFSGYMTIKDHTYYNNILYISQKVDERICKHYVYCDIVNQRKTVIHQFFLLRTGNANIFFILVSAAFMSYGQIDDFLVPSCSTH